MRETLLLNGSPLTRIVHFRNDDACAQMLPLPDNLNNANSSAADTIWYIATLK